MMHQTPDALIPPFSGGAPSTATGWMVAVRGATSVDEDTPEAIQRAMHSLMQALAERNGWFEPKANARVVSVWISVTSDLQTCSAASALRHVLPVWNHIALFCAQEPQVRGMLPQVIRVLVLTQWHTPEYPTPMPVYLGAAAQLRPDLLNS
ncbi:MAG: chorismate mutase [Vampirovibrionales bacterium]|nr:chorismate mutase [Vampirovibrionales bacterium]